jgi:hypothetical protein
MVIEDIAERLLKYFKEQSMVYLAIPVKLETSCVLKRVRPLYEL